MASAFAPSRNRIIQPNSSAPPLSDQAVQQIVETSARRIIRLCTKRGLLGDTVADPLADEEPVLAALTAASVRGLRPAAIGCGGATLLARVFSSDISECAACGERLRIIASLTDPALIQTYLEGVGLSAMPPARIPPQPQFEFAA